MRKNLLIIFLLVITTSSKAQINNDSLEYRLRPDSLKTGELHLSIYNFNYLRNYEYFNDFQDGYTLYGTQLEPQLVYYAHQRLSVSGGIHLRKNFGSNGIYETYPLFSIKYQKNNTAFINGVLEGNTHHRYVEPVFDFEKKIIDPVEYGSQLIISKPQLFLDLWINWKQMIYKPSPVQEQILAGGSADITLLRSARMFLSAPLQIIAFHQGGQIDTATAPLQTLVNMAAGFKLRYQLNGFISSIRTENYALTFNDASPDKLQAYKKGTGYFLNAGVDTKYGNLTGSYWNGTGFISANGMPIYQSVSQQINNPGYTEKRRELIILRYAYQKQLIPNFYLDFRIEPVFDLKNPSQQIDFSHSLFLMYKQEFRLIKAK